MKVFHIITGLEQGGAEMVLYQLIKATRETIQHEVVALGGEGYYGPRLRACGVLVHHLEMRRGRISWVGLWRLYTLLTASKADIMQTWMYHANLLGGLVARLAGVRAVVWSVHNLNLDQHLVRLPTRIIGYVSGWLSPILQNAIVYVGDNAARFHHRIGYRSAKARVISNGVDVRAFRVMADKGRLLREELGISPDDFLLGFVARWDKYKDHRNLFAALSRLNKDHWRCILVGPEMDENNRELMAALSDHDLPDKIILAGARDDIPVVMNALDLHILSSVGEGFGNVTAEAMACGTPCVTTDVGSGAAIVGDTGWVVPAASPSALAQAIQAGRAAIENVGKSSLGPACRKRIEDHFSLEAMAESYVGLWKSVIAKSSI